jgi:hypothetical protein
MRRSVAWSMVMTDNGKIGDAIDIRDTIARMIPIADVLYDTFIRHLAHRHFELAPDGRLTKLLEPDG